MPPARDSREALAVESSAIGAAAAFDGNYTNDLVSWLFPNEKWTAEAVPQMLEELMLYTMHGHLAWCVFAPGGFRI